MGRDGEGMGKERWGGMDRVWAGKKRRKRRNGAPPPSIQLTLVELGKRQATSQPTLVT